MRISLLALAAVCIGANFAAHAPLPLQARDFTEAQKSSRPWDRPRISDLSSINGILSEADASFDRNLTKEAILDRLIAVKSGLPEDPQLPEAFVAEIKKALCVYPRSVLCFLLKERCRIVAAPLVTIADSELVDKPSRGYKTDQTYANCRAVFVPRTGTIIVASHYYKRGVLLLNQNPAAGAQHELCHAVDCYLGRPSLSRSFFAAYSRDKAQVSLVDQSLLYYYLQSGDGGPIETFGQLLANKYSHFQEHRTLALVRCFPECRRLVDGIFPSEL